MQNVIVRLYLFTFVLSLMLALTGCNGCNNVVDHNVATQHNNNSRL